MFRLYEDEPSRSQQISFQFWSRAEVDTRYDAECEGGFPSKTLFVARFTDLPFPLTRDTFGSFLRVRSYSRMHAGGPSSFKILQLNAIRNQCGSSNTFEVEPPTLAADGVHANTRSSTDRRKETSCLCSNQEISCSSVYLPDMTSRSASFKSSWPRDWNRDEIRCRNVGDRMLPRQIRIVGFRVLCANVKLAVEMLPQDASNNVLPLEIQ